jgi:hypothetical protein
VGAAGSILAHAREIMVFRRFLAESRGGKPIWECGTAGLRACKRVRLQAPGPAHVSVSTWRRSGRWIVAPGSPRWGDDEPLQPRQHHR